MTLIALILVHLSAMPTIHVWVRNHFKTLEKWRLILQRNKKVLKHSTLELLALENACYLIGEYSSVYLLVLFNRKS
jgi:hypothetical protein